jgi:hypothetical protein
VFVVVAVASKAQQASECEFDANGRVKPVEMKPQLASLPPGPPLHLLAPVDLADARPPEVRAYLWEQKTDCIIVFMS